MSLKQKIKDFFQPLIQEFGFIRIKKHNQIVQGLSYKHLTLLNNYQRQRETTKNLIFCNEQLRIRLKGWNVDKAHAAKNNRRRIYHANQRKRR